MNTNLQNKIGIYEKALLSDMSWEARLQIAQEAGYDFIELSIDQSDERMARLKWTQHKRDAFNRTVTCSGISVPMMALTSLRDFPLGSTNDAIRNKGLSLVRDSIRLASDLGIQVLQLAGYDVYDQQSTDNTRSRFLTGLEQSLPLAESADVILSLENMDIEYTSSIARVTEIVKKFQSPYLRVYADFGNTCAWGNDLEPDLQAGKGYLLGVHVKDSLPKTFRRVPFGEGVVDFIAGFTTLRQIQYNGSFCVEMWSDDTADFQEKITHARKWVAKKMASSACI
jgi:L-ribulose-5-phosphate 3-epimerase